MTNPIQKAVTSPSEGNAELRKLDRQEGHEYLPMNVFVDPATMKTHFRCLLNDAHWGEIHPVA